jgi:hypothetical protein
MIRTQGEHDLYFSKAGKSLLCARCKQAIDVGQEYKCGTQRTEYTAYWCYFHLSCAPLTLAGILGEEHAR